MALAKERFARNGRCNWFLNRVTAGQVRTAVRTEDMCYSDLLDSRPSPLRWES